LGRGRSRRRVWVGGGEAFADALLLAADGRGGLGSDRQASAKPVCLVVVVDQDIGAVRILLQAVEGEGVDLVGAPSGVDEQLGGDSDLDAAHGLQLVEVGAQLAQHLVREVTASLSVLGLVGHVFRRDCEVGRHPLQQLPGRGEAEGTEAEQDPADEPGEGQAPGRADLPGRGEVAHAVGEGHDVAAPPCRRDRAAVRTLYPKALREHAHGRGKPRRLTSRVVQMALSVWRQCASSNPGTVRARYRRFRCALQYGSFPLTPSR
jgi:hypothetical protein